MTGVVENKVSIKSTKTIKNPVLILFSIFYVLYPLAANSLAYGKYMCIFLVLSLLCIVIDASVWLNKRWNKSSFVSLLVLGTILLNIRSFRYIKRAEIYIAFMLVVMFSIFFVRSGGKSRRIAIDIIMFGAIINAFLVWISHFAPEFYIRYFTFYFHVSARNSVVNVLNQGYAVGLHSGVAATATYLVAGIAASFSKIAQKHRARHIMLMIFLFIALLFVNRRGEALSMTVALIVSIYIISKKNNRRRMIVLGANLFMLALVIIFLIKNELIVYAGDSRAIKSVFDVLSGKDITNGRAILYMRAWQLFLQAPFVGIGWGEYFFTAKVTSIPKDVHNIYLQLLCETGVLGTIVIVGALFSLVYCIYRNYKVTKGLLQSRYSLFALIIILYICILGIFDNPIYYEYFWLLLGIIIFCGFPFGTRIQHGRRKEVKA